MIDTTKEMLDNYVTLFLSFSGTISTFFNCFGIYMILHQHGTMDDFRYGLLFFQINLLIFDIYFSFFMIPIPIFPIIGGYCIGIMTKTLEISTHFQMIFALWCVGNINTCIFVSLLKRHQVVSKIEQKHLINAKFLKLTKLSVYISPLFGTLIYATSEPSEINKTLIISQKYPLYSFILKIPGIAIYDIDFSLNPVFFFVTYCIMVGSLILLTSYHVLYIQLFIMLQSVKRKISVRTYKKHFAAVLSTVFQNVVFFIFYIVPIFMLATVIYFGFDASVICVIMVCIFSLHSTATTIVMILTFPAFRRSIFETFEIMFCYSKKPPTPVPVTHMSKNFH